jgi:hypothetical protein
MVTRMALAEAGCFGVSKCPSGLRTVPADRLRP